tara:strand:- start:395 stop:574 length:180 start_codon:yes stop_codon:yes gene_type:complete
MSLSFVFRKNRKAFVMKVKGSSGIVGWGVGSGTNWKVFSCETVIGNRKKEYGQDANPPR